MKRVIATQSVNHGGQWRERGTVFTVVDAPKGELEVSATEAADWQRRGWVSDQPGGKGKAAGEGG